MSCNNYKKKEIVNLNQNNKDISLDNKIQLDSNTLLYIKHSPCLDSCAVYEVSILKDTSLIFNGIKYVNKTGKYTTKLSDSLFDLFHQTFDSVKFKNLNNSYITRKLEGFPATTIATKDKSIHIKMWKEAPLELTNIFIFVEDLLYQHNLLKVEK